MKIKITISDSVVKGLLREYPHLNEDKIESIFIHGKLIHEEERTPCGMHRREYRIVIPNDMAWQYDIPKSLLLMIGEDGFIYKTEEVDDKMNIKIRLESKDKDLKETTRKARVNDINAPAYSDSYGSAAAVWRFQASVAKISYNETLYIVNEKNGYVALGKENDVRFAIAWVRKKDVTIVEDSVKVDFNNYININNVDASAKITKVDNSLFIDDMEIKIGEEFVITEMK